MQHSFSFSNDLFGDEEDRWRTSATELTIGKWSIGTYVNTNWGAENDKDRKRTTDIAAPLLGKNKYMTPTPYFLNYDEFKTGGYFYSGYKNPHSLW